MDDDVAAAAAAAEEEEEEDPDPGGISIRPPRPSVGQLRRRCTVQSARQRPSVGFGADSRADPVRIRAGFEADSARMREDPAGSSAAL